MSRESPRVFMFHAMQPMDVPSIVGGTPRADALSSRVRLPDVDHVRAERAQLHRRPRSHHPLSEIEYANALQSSPRHAFCLRSGAFIAACPSRQLYRFRWPHHSARPGGDPVPWTPECQGPPRRRGVRWRWARHDRRTRPRSVRRRCRLCARAGSASRRSPRTAGRSDQSLRNWVWQADIDEGRPHRLDAQ